MYNQKQWQQSPRSVTAYMFFFAEVAAACRSAANTASDAVVSAPSPSSVIARLNPAATSQGAADATAPPPLVAADA